jgi:hypothetical protein
MIALASEATRLENRPEDAAALLMDAAALLVSETGAGPDEFIDRFKQSYEILNQTRDMVNTGQTRPS